MRQVKLQQLSNNGYGYCLECKCSVKNRQTYCTSGSDYCYS